MSFPPVPKKKQTRCAISVKGLTYARLKAWHAAPGKPISGLIENLIQVHLTACGIPEQTELWANGKPKPDDVETIASQHFTF